MVEATGVLTCSGDGIKKEKKTDLYVTLKYMILTKYVRMAPLMPALTARIEAGRVHVQRTVRRCGANKNISQQFRRY